MVKKQIRETRAIKGPFFIKFGTAYLTDVTNVTCFEKILHFASKAVVF